MVRQTTTLADDLEFTILDQRATAFTIYSYGKTKKVMKINFRINDEHRST